VTQFRFLAFLTLDPPAQDEPNRQYPSGSHDLMIRCHSMHWPALLQYFPASIFRDDDEPLRPGDDGIWAAVEVSDEDAPEFLGPGQHITLWNGHDCGHGVISRRVYTQWA
jgi:hypothetical protein